MVAQCENRAFAATALDAMIVTEAAIMARKKKTWREKLADAKDLPRVETITESMRSYWGAGSVVIPAPADVDALMRRVPKGKVTTIDHLRRCLARINGATIGCPMTTGIFALIAARAAEEDELDGKKRVTPYWRTLKAGGVLNPKYPGGLEEVARRLEDEGHVVRRKGKTWRVVDFEKAVVEFDG